MAKVRVYNYSAEELQKMIDEYFEPIEQDVSLECGPNDLLYAMKMDMDTAEFLTKNTDGNYKKHSNVMKMAAIRLYAAMDRRKSANSMFNRKQRIWWGRPYSDKVEGRVNATMRVIFGSKNDKSDPFG